MSFRKKLQSAVAGAGVALHTVLTPTTSRLEEPQSQSIPDKDYEGVKRGLGGAFQPADEEREDVWRVQSRSSPEANAFFYGTDKKQYLKGHDLGSSDDLGHGQVGETNVHRGELKRVEELGKDGVRALNDATWEIRKGELAKAGRLHGETLAQHPAARAQRADVTEAYFEAAVGPRADARGVVAAHTCGEKPTEICHACLEANR